MTLFAQEGKRYVEGYLESDNDFLIFIQCEGTDDEVNFICDPLFMEKEIFRAKHSKLRNVMISTMPEFEIDGWEIFTTLIFFQYEDEGYQLQINDEDESIIKRFEQFFKEKGRT